MPIISWSQFKDITDYTLKLTTVYAPKNGAGMLPSQYHMVLGS